MTRNKRIVERLWAGKRMGGYIFSRSNLLDALKKGEVVELDKVIVGTATLRKLINLLLTDNVLLRANGNLEVETVAAIPRKCADGVYRCGFRKPKKGYRQFMSIVNKAWIPKGATKVVVLKPRKY